MHFDNSHGTYFDFGNHSEKVYMVRCLILHALIVIFVHALSCMLRVFERISSQVRLVWQLVEESNGFPSRKLVREVSKEPVLGLVPHIGYISLFPMIWRIIPPVSCI